MKKGLDRQQWMYWNSIIMTVYEQGHSADVNDRRKARAALRRIRMKLDAVDSLFKNSDALREHYESKPSTEPAV